MNGLTTWPPVKAPRLASASAPSSEVRSSSLLPAADGPQRLDLGSLGVGGEHVDQRVLGRHHGVGHAEAGVGARREDPQVEPGCSSPDDLQVELDPFGPPDPVALHGLDPLGPVQAVERVEQLVGVGRGAEEPLLELPLDHEVAGALAGAVGQDLLVGQDGLAARAPVDRGQGAVGQAGLEEPEEDDLVPADVGRVVAADLPAPVVDRAEALHAGLQLGDAGLGEGPRVLAGADGGVLGGQAEGVEAEGRQHGVSLHGAVPDEQVAEGVVPDVALVGGPARVGVHAQDVLRRARVVGIDLVEAAVGPALLPLALDFLHVIGPRHAGILGNAPRRAGHRARGRGVSTDRAEGTLPAGRRAGSTGRRGAFRAARAPHHLVLERYRH